MGYRIEYDQGTERYEVMQDNPWRVWILTAICFGIFMMLSNWFWPEGSAFIRDILIPGDDAVTVQAFTNMTEELRSGTAVKEAVTAFCNEVLIGEPALR